MAAGRVGFVGAAGPDSLRIPAEPSRLKQAAQQLNDLAGDIQAHDLPQLRRRWAQAQEQFLAAVRQGATPVPDPHALIAPVDENLLRPYEDLFRELPEWAWRSPPRSGRTDPDQPRHCEKSSSLNHDSMT